jgi:hypothetical protein
MDDTTSTFFETVIAGQIRHVLTGVAGTLVAHGALQADQSTSFTQIGAGMAMYLVGAGWSWWQKSGQEQVLAQFAKLRHHVAAIPVVSVVSAASPSAARDALKINEAVSSAKEVASATPAEAAEIPAPPPPSSFPTDGTPPPDRMQRL